MKRIDYLVFGYKSFYFDSPNLKKAANLLLEHNLSADFHAQRIDISIFDLKNIAQHFQELNIRRANFAV